MTHLFEIYIEEEDEVEICGGDECQKDARLATPSGLS